VLLAAELFNAMVLVFPNVAVSELISKVAVSEASGVMLIPAEPVPNPLTGDVIFNITIINCCCTCESCISS